MATLADSFLADFESSGDETDKSDDESDKETQQNIESLVSNMPDAVVEDIDFDTALQADDQDEALDKARGMLSHLSRLLSGDVLDTHLAKVDQLMAATLQSDGTHQNVDRHAEYDIIVRSNELAAQIDNEMSTIVKFIRDLYSTKYQELEELVQIPVDYARVVQIIGNHTDMTSVTGALGDILPQHTILTISVTATTTMGKPLPPEDLARVLEACSAVIKLDDAKKKIEKYVESRMTFMAPNVSALVGTEIGARLMAIAGGLLQLSHIPACNLQVLGARKKALEGLSAANADIHTGILVKSPVLSMCPSALRLKALRLLAGKCILAARIDSFGQDQTGNTGIKFFEEVQQKIEKWQEPPPAKLHKALPAPNDKPRNKRGGKRYRKAKERFAVTDMTKQRNRMAMDKPEATDEYTGEGFGMLGQAGTGQLTVRQKDPHQLKKHLSRKTQARLRRVQVSGTQTQLSGTSSNIALSSVQGLELVDHSQQNKQEAGAEKYFSATAGFLNVKPTSKQERERQAAKLEQIAAANAALKAPAFQPTVDLMTYGLKGDDGNERNSKRMKHQADSDEDE
jgi:U4/U6 small nuclear ribonucleoprotein PRP31